jgi:GNAT superfamily N-acetyltransferase
MNSGINICIKMIQRIPVYRRIVRPLRVRISVREACEEDERKYITWLHPGKTDLPIQSDITCTYFIAEMGGRFIGSVDLVRRPSKYYPHDGYWLSSLSVRTAYRGMGLGEELSKQVISKSKEEGSQVLSLLVREDNYIAIQLYKKLGFQIKVNPELEKQFEQERRAQGRSMILMCASLT